MSSAVGSVFVTARNVPALRRGNRRIRLKYTCHIRAALSRFRRGSGLAVHQSQGHPVRTYGYCYVHNAVLPLSGSSALLLSLFGIHLSCLHILLGHVRYRYTAVAGQVRKAFQHRDGDASCIYCGFRVGHAPSHTDADSRCLVERGMIPGACWEKADALSERKRRDGKGTPAPGFG